MGLGGGLASRRRGVRMAGLGLATFVCLAALVIAAPSSASAAPLAKLQDEGCPEYHFSGQDFSAETIADAKRYRFKILGRRIKLEPRIDWDRRRFGSTPFLKQLNDLSWIDPLLDAYDRFGDMEALRVARRIAFDWARQHGGPTPNFIKWERKRAGDRGSRIAYVARAGACEGTLKGRQASKMVADGRAHGHFLFKERDSGKKGASNHGLLRDLGLVLIAEYLPFVRGASDWERRGIHRFRRGVDRLVHQSTGVHLEQTPGYQGKTVGHVDRFLAALNDPPDDLVALLGRMRDVSAWFVFHDDFTVPIGDTPYYHDAPQYAVEGVAGAQGLAPNLDRAGYGVVREGSPVTGGGGSYFATAAQYHTIPHKHSDELTFDLFEGGVRVIVDSGRRNHAQNKNDPRLVRIREFTQSAHAHSTVIADGRSWAKRGGRYGTAIDAQGASGPPGPDTWYAVLGHNPMLKRQQGVRHERLFLYKPGHALVVFDELDSGRGHEYGRYFQLGPEIKAERDGSSLVRLREYEGDFRGTIWNQPHPKNRRTKLYRGKDSGPLRGWWVPPGFGGLKPRYAVQLRSFAQDAEHLATISFDETPVEAVQLAANTFRIDDPGPLQSASDVTVQRDGSELVVTAEPVP